MPTQSSPQSVSPSLTPTLDLTRELIRELIAKGDLSAVREAMEKSMAEGSQSFEQCLADMVRDGRVAREEALAAADSPTNLLWRLQNEFAPRPSAQPPAAETDEPSFREISLDLGAH